MTTSLQRTTRLRRHRIFDFIWLVIPLITLLGVFAYLVGALILHENPPAIAIQSQSMNPTVSQGDLAIIKAIDPRALKASSVVAIKLTGPEQTKYSLPPEIIRRIVKITRTNGSEVFVTKADGNPANDPFTVASGAVAGKVVGVVPDLGYPILFFSSKQGVIFLIATAIILLIYYILGFLEDRRHYAHATAATMQNVMEMVGYVHDVVQENQAMALEKLAFTRPELTRSQNYISHGLDDTPETPTDNVTRPIQSISNDLTVSIRPELERLLQQSSELRIAADWASTGELDNEQVRTLFIKTVEMIESLLLKLGDPDMAPRTQVEMEHLNHAPGFVNFPISKGFIEKQRYGTDLPLENDPPFTQNRTAEPNPLEQSPMGDNIQTPLGENETSRSSAGEETSQDQFEAYNSTKEINSVVDMTDMDLVLLAEDQLDIFENQNSIFDREENVFDETIQHTTATPPASKQANKRHHRRTIRRQD